MPNPQTTTAGDVCQQALDIWNDHVLTPDDLYASIPDWIDVRLDLPKADGQYIVRLKTGEAKIIGFNTGGMCNTGWDEPYHDQVLFWMPVENLSHTKSEESS